MVSCVRISFWFKFSILIIFAFLLIFLSISLTGFLFIEKILMVSFFYIYKCIASSQALHEDIMDHKEAFEELTEVAQTLMGLVGDDEAQMVVEKLQDATNHFARVVESSEHIGQLLAEAFQGLGSFNVNYEDLMAWIDEMQSRFSRFRILSVYVEKLQEQLDELVVSSILYDNEASNIVFLIQWNIFILI